MCIVPTLPGVNREPIIRYNTGMNSVVHHAIVFHGPGALNAARKRAAFVLGVAEPVHPDLTEFIHDAFGIDESRTLKERAAQRPMLGEVQVFVVATHIVTHHAQNSLLKLLEEPVPGTHFFFALSGPMALLPTVLSRVRTEYAGDQADELDVATFEAYLDATPAKRIKLVEHYYSKLEKDRIGTIAFIEGLERTLHRMMHQKGTLDARAAARARRVLEVHGYVASPSFSPKLLLEYLSLVL